MLNQVVMKEADVSASFFAYQYLAGEAFYIYAAALRHQESGPLTNN